jgi:GTP pyrophosphokinase
MDCTNVANLLMDEGRIIEVQWLSDVRASYTAGIQIMAEERVGVLLDLSQVLMNLNISIKAMNAKTDVASNSVGIQMSFDVNSTEQLDTIIKNMRKVKSVLDVRRLNV